LVVTPVFVSITKTEADWSGLPREKTLPVIIKSWALTICIKMKTITKFKRMK